MGERLEYTVELPVPYDAVVSVIDDPALLVESVPDEYAEWKDPEGTSVVVRTPKGFFKFRGEFTVSASIKGPGDVVLYMNSESGSIEFRLRAERIADKLTSVQVDVTSAGVKLKKLSNIIDVIVKNMMTAIEERARSVEREVAVAVASGSEGSQVSPQVQQSMSEALTTRRALPSTSKLEDPFFEADMLLRGRPVYSDVVAYTGLADVIEPFIDESMKGQLYIKIEFPGNFTLKLLVEKGRIVGALATMGDDIFKDYEAVLEAEKRAPAKTTMLVLSI